MPSRRPAGTIGTGTPVSGRRDDGQQSSEDHRPRLGAPQRCPGAQGRRHTVRRPAPAARRRPAPSPTSTAAGADRAAASSALLRCPLLDPAPALLRRQVLHPGHHRPPHPVYAPLGPSASSGARMPSVSQAVRQTGLAPSGRIREGVIPCRGAWWGKYEELVIHNASFPRLDTVTLVTPLWNAYSRGEHRGQCYFYALFLHNLCNFGAKRRNVLCIFLHIFFYAFSARSGEKYFYALFLCISREARKNNLRTF